jgi:hypothetical protein
METREKNQNNSAAGCLQILIMLTVAALVVISMIVFSPGILLGAVLNKTLNVDATAILWAFAVGASLTVYAMLCWVCGGIKPGSVVYLTLALILFLGGSLYLTGIAENPKTSSLYVTLTRLYPFILGPKKASRDDLHSGEQSSPSVDYTAQSLTPQLPDPAFTPPVLSDGMSLAEVRETVGHEGNLKGHLELSAQRTDLYRFMLSNGATLRCTFINDKLASWTVEELPL